MPSESAAAYYCHSSVRTLPFWVFIITQPRNSLMNPADRHHSQFPAASKDCSTLFNLNNPYHNHSKSANTSNFIFPNHHSSGGGSSAPNNNVHNSINPNNRNNTNNNSGSSHAHATMGGQTPVFFSPSSFVVGSHKSSQELHDAMLNANKQLSNRSGPLQLVDFKEGIRGGGEGVNGMIGAASEEVRMAKRPHISFVRGGQDYDPGPGSTRSAGEDMSVDYVDQMDGGDYLDPLEGVGELMKKGSRRLGYDQVKALEKAFENENRLEPERKVRLASQLGLQPRQVAVWFQNRRARWKTKQMERDYTLLKNKFEALKADRDKLLQEKDHLQAELARLKGNPPPVDSMPENKEATEGEQSSPTLASCLVVVDDAAPHQQAKGSNQATRSHRADEQVDEEIEEEEEVAEEEASPSNRMMHEQKLQQNDSLSSTEDSDMNNGGTIVNSSSKAFQEEADYYTQQWRLPQAPTQLLYKPTSIKNEEWPEHAENMNSFNMHLDANWYNWGC